MTEGDYGTMGGMVVASLLVTEIVMRVTPERIARRLYGLPVSVLSGILISVVWALVFKNVAVGYALIRGLFIGGTASGAFSSIKTGNAWKKHINHSSTDGEGGEAGVE